MYAEFDLVIPTDIEGALAALAESESDTSVVPLCGGTNTMVDLRSRSVAPDTLVQLGKLPELRGIKEEDGKVIVGGTTTVSDLLRHPDMPRLGAAIVDAAKVFAGQMVRNAATIAGNICCGSPAADLVPPLLALDAVVTLQSKEGSREVPLSDFYTGYKQNVRQPNELITQVSWPVPAANSTNTFYKLARRKGDAITIVGVAVSMTVEQGKCEQVRIALGSVSPYVKRATQAEAFLQGQALTPELIQQAAESAVDESSPVDDVRATAEYRKHGVLTLTRRLLTQALESLS